jgi:hypothetical protein
VNGPLRQPCNPDPKRLAEAIRAALARGLDVSPRVLDFIDSTFLNPSLPALERLIRQEASPEVDSLLQLLFCPEEPLQEALEEQIGAGGWKVKDEPRIAGYLCRPPLSVAFRFPAGRGTLALTLTAPLAARFVSQLNIGRRIPPALGSALDAALAASERIRVRVRIRNSRVAWSESALEFMACWLKKMGPAAAREPACLDFVLEFLAERSGEAGIFERLAARRRLLAKTLQCAGRQQALLAQSNVETLMSRGIRIASFDEAETRRQAAFIDRIGAAVYGARWDRLPRAGAAEPIELAAGDAAELMRLLSEPGGD